MTCLMYKKRFETPSMRSCVSQKIKIFVFCSETFFLLQIDVPNAEGEDKLHPSSFEL